MRVELAAALSLPPMSLARRFGAGWLVQTPAPELLVLGDHLVEQVRFALPSSARGMHWVSADRAHAVVAGGDRVLLLDPGGHALWESAHHPWSGDGESGSCWMSPDGRHVWATAPTDDGADEWRVLDASAGRVLATTALQCRASGSTVVPHPDGRHVGLSVGEGLDGAEVYWGRWEGERPVVARLDDRTRVLVDVHPGGSAYLTTPHGDSDGSLTVHEFPGGAAARRLPHEGVFADGDWFDEHAGYLAPDLILVASAEAQVHLLLDADTLERVGEIEYPFGEGLREGIATSQRDTWLTSDFLTGRHELWRLVRAGSF